MLSLKQSKIIVRMPNWIGDVVMATPLLEDIKRSAPDCHLTVLANHPDLFVGHPDVDEIFPFDKKKIVEADIGLLLPNSFSSAWHFYRSGVTHRVGYRSDFRAPLLTRGMKVSSRVQEQHLVVTYKELLQCFGIGVSPTKPKLYLRDDERLWASDFLDSMGIGQQMIAIHPGAAYGSAKCWPPSRFRDLAQKLLSWNENIHLMFVGTPDQQSLLDSITNGLSHRVHNLAGKTSLRQLMSLIAAAKVFVTNDSGPMHIAAALDVPLVALFGSTSSVKTGPYKSGVVIQKDTDCSPCYKRTCPIDFRCMRAIRAEEVFQNVVRLCDC